MVAERPAHVQVPGVALIDPLMTAAWTPAQVHVPGVAEMVVAPSAAQTVPAQASAFQAPVAHARAISSPDQVPPQFVVLLLLVMIGSPMTWVTLTAGGVAGAGAAATIL